LEYARCHKHGNPGRPPPGGHQFVGSSAAGADCRDVFLPPAGGSVRRWRPRVGDPKGQAARTVALIGDEAQQASGANGRVLIVTPGRRPQEATRDAPPVVKVPTTSKSRREPNYDFLLWSSGQVASPSSLPEITRGSALLTPSLLAPCFVRTP